MNITLIRSALLVAVSKIGVKETTGKNDGPFVNECMAVVNLDNQKQFDIHGVGYAWCAAFVSWVFDKIGANAIKNAWAPAWFPPGKLVTDGTFLPMDVVAIKYNGINNGHVFLVLADIDKNQFLSIEGNWGGQVSVNVRMKSEISGHSRWL